MKIVLHMGVGKTGTTALQTALAASRHQLAAEGIHYPEFARGDIAQHMLVALTEAPERLPHFLTKRYGGAAGACAAAEAQWRLFCTQITAARPAVLVLSSELLLFMTRRAAKERLAARLAELASEVQPVIYIREPVSHYRSRLQEWFKAQNAPLPPTPLPLRAAIEETERAFGHTAELRAYDPALLSGGDTVSDFFAEVLHIAPDAVPRHPANVGLSAEAILLLRDFRARSVPGAGGAPSPESLRLLAALHRIEKAASPHPALALRPEVARAVLRGAVDYLWLAEARGLRFPGLDYAAIDGAPIPVEMFTAPLEALIEHSPARLHQLALEVIGTLLTPPQGSRT